MLVMSRSDATLSPNQQRQSTDKQLPNQQQEKLRARAKSQSEHK